MERSTIFAALSHRASLPKPGVVIVQDYMGLPQQPGHQMVHADEANGGSKNSGKTIWYGDNIPSGNVT